MPTIAVGEVLAVYNWTPDKYRYKKLEAFVDAFFDNFKEFLKPIRHRKWKEVNLAATLPGWTRFEPAEKKLQQMLAARRVAGGEDHRALFTNFVQNFAGKKVSKSETAELYKNFLKWVSQRQ